MYTIDKQFSFCYGHRVYVQKLNQDFCGEDNKPKCRHLHGHEGLVHIFLESEWLNEQSMVTDFKHLGWLKSFIDNTLDHKFVIDFNDPMFQELVINVHGKSVSDYIDLEGYLVKHTVPVFVPGTNFAVGRTVALAETPGTPQYETLQGYFIVDFVPTSENLSAWMWALVQAKMAKIEVKVSRVDWFETPKSRASFVPSEAAYLSLSAKID